MKKLKIKVFATISIILSIFVFCLLFSTTTKNYFQKKATILNILNRITMSSNVHNKYEPNQTNETLNKPPIENIPNNDINNIRRIYLGFNVYTIVLDEKGKYKELINHTENESIDEEEIRKVAEEIIESHKDIIYVGNLYIEKYAYSFTNDRTLIIIDNTNINNELRENIFVTVSLFILLEFIIIILTMFLTKWIIVPVKESFENQKRFIADASHELKTPLSIMIASADAYFNDQNDKWVKNMRSESERMIKLVTELLDLSATEKPKDFPMKEENLSSIIESSILTYESMFYENKLKLNYNILPDIKFECNASQIKQLMVILMDNAIKYSTKNGRVTIHLYKNNKTILLEVKNNGTPIKKEDTEKIFERFYKVDSSRNRNKNNYGLGLAIAKNIVDNHNGNIIAYSEKNITTFKVTWNQK